MPALSASNSTSSNTGSATSTSTATATAPLDKLKELKRRLLVTLLTVIFYYYPSLLTTALSLFECYHIDPVSPQNGQYYPGQVRGCIMAQLLYIANRVCDDTTQRLCFFYKDLWQCKPERSTPT